MGLATTLFTVLLPVALMLLQSASDVFLPEGNQVRALMDFIGDPITALLAALLLRSTPSARRGASTPGGSSSSSTSAWRRRRRSCSS